jgi:opacity protein-like surface antigen
VAGGGIEYAFTDMVSAGVEYLHYEFDDASAEVIRGRVNVTFNSLFGM